MSNTTFDELSGIPEIDFRADLKTAVMAGRRMTSILSEVVRLRRGPGKLTPNEYFYYRLWEDRYGSQDRPCFVGKQAQHPMHMACNHTGWYAAAADKLLFQTVMAGAGLPVPTLLAIAHLQRGAPGIPMLNGPALASFLRNGANYPIFIKPTDGKYSLSVRNAYSYDEHADRIDLVGQGRVSIEHLAAELTRREAGYLIQRRLEPNIALRDKFGPALWSVRLLVFVTPSGPVLHRAVAKIATGDNPADNYWRSGNMLGAINMNTGLIESTVRGTGTGMVFDEAHPDTKRPIVGTAIPDWWATTDLVRTASQVLPGVRTQSWDIALTDTGPVLLEVNFGGDLNLHQLAHRSGVLDDAYLEHLRRCGYRI